MAYSNFPVGYNPYGMGQNYTGYMPQGNGQGYGGYGAGSYQPVLQQPAQGQMLTPPTIHAEIVQVDTEQAAENYPVGPGASQMLMAKDDSFIAVKTALPNGQYTLTVFEKRPEAPKAPAFDPKDYVRRDELPDLIAAAFQAQPGATQPMRQGRGKAGNNNESV